jgi:hypothetical protein
MRRLAIIPILLILLVTGCVTQGQTIKDQAIQYRSAFNTVLSQFNTELAVMPIDQQKIWAQRAVPFMSAGVLALQTIDMQANAGAPVTQETIQAYLVAKNQMIDLIANLVLAKKGAK